MIEEAILQMYKEESKKYGMKDRRSLFWTKDKQDARFHLLLGEPLKLSGMSLLDFGCGFADLAGFLRRNFYRLEYNGCDLNPDFVEEAASRYPGKKIYRIESVDDIEERYDIVLASGTFNLIGIDDAEKMQKYVFDHLLKLFEHTDYMLTVNFLSHLTDAQYRYPGHFYLDLVALYTFAVEHMSSRVQIDTGGLPFEITVKIYKNTQIDPETVLYEK